MIAIIDYGMGNLGSVANMLKKAGATAQITADPLVIQEAEKLILPGVGSFDSGMRNLEQRGLLPLLNRLVIEERRPILGLCLGMQLLTESSEEGSLPGLGWINGSTVRFHFQDDQAHLKVPHMGWNMVQVARACSIFQTDDVRLQRFYFAHSYYIVLEDPTQALAYSTYGYPFVSAVQHDNIVGVQFHPEKSHSFGLNLMRNFAAGRT